MVVRSSRSGYAPPMVQRPRARLLAPGGVLLAFLGVWLGHTVEYVRVWGVAGLGNQLRGPIHGYMLPLAGVLLGLSVIFGLRLRRLWLRLGRRLDRARSDLLGIWRGQRLEPEAVDPEPPSAASPASSRTDSSARPRRPP